MEGRCCPASYVGRSWRQGGLHRNAVAVRLPEITNAHPEEDTARAVSSLWPSSWVASATVDPMSGFSAGSPLHVLIETYEQQPPAVER
jgi:hypothetical protein